MQEELSMLTDKHFRKHNYLRISVTDKCNLRCRYCMPPEGVEFLPHDQVLRNEEFIDLIKIFVNMGITKIRFTGGEPLVRRDLMGIISETRRRFPHIEMALTTNGILLKDHLKELRELNVKKLNISLDTLSRQRFEDLTCRDHFNDVISSIEAALAEDFFNVKINSVLFASTLDEIDSFMEYFSDKKVDLRFIERMPVTEQDRFNEFIPSDALVSLLQSKGELTRKNTNDTAVAMMYEMKYKGSIINLGIIPPVTHRFCSSCNRLRLTSEGNLRTCLYADHSYNLKDMLRSGDDEDAITGYINQAIKEKEGGHHIECTSDNRGCRSITSSFTAMSKIGG